MDAPQSLDSLGFFWLTQKTSPCLVCKFCFPCLMSHILHPGSTFGSWSAQRILWVLKTSKDNNMISLCMLPCKHAYHLYCFEVVCHMGDPCLLPECDDRIWLKDSISREQYRDLLGLDFIKVKIACRPRSTLSFSLAR